MNKLELLPADEFPRLSESECAEIQCGLAALIVQENRLELDQIKTVGGSFVKAAPHKDCRSITSANFSSDCTKSTNKAGAYEEILGKNDGKFASKRTAKCEARSLCGVALIAKYAYV